MNSCHCERSEAICENDASMFENNCLNFSSTFRLAFKYFCSNPTDCFTTFAMTAIYNFFEIASANLSKSSSKCKALITKRVTGKSVAVG